MKKLIVFDWDDTLTAGSKEWYFSLYHKAIAAVDVTLPKDEEQKWIIEKWGRPHEEELAHLLREHPEKLEAACNVYEQLLDAGHFGEFVTLHEGVLDLLDRLSANHTLAVSTGMNGDLLRDKMIPHFGIPDVFKKIVSSYDFDDPKQYKPSPFALHHIMSELGFTPEETVMVGDAAADVKMAQAAGVDIVVVLSGHLNETQARSLGVTQIIPDVTHLESVLEVE